MTYRSPRGDPFAYFWVFFFFQAEDGIRDVAVTGVQTCALPISARRGALSPRCRAARGPPRRSRGSRTRAALAGWWRRCGRSHGRWLDLPSSDGIMTDAACAEVAELADALDSGASAPKGVGGRVPASAPTTPCWPRAPPGPTRRSEPYHR